MTGIAILGATGSIGASALAVLEQHPDRFRLVAATANRNAEALAEIRRRHPGCFCVLAESEGMQPLIDAATHPDADIVLNAVVGAAGLEPTIAALRAGKRVALANKESLVCGGELVERAAREGGGELIPVDSEHSAIFQCLAGSAPDEVERLILTASGGPFRTMDPERLAHVTAADALRHPTWTMGDKITIDSATLANKALEVIEAHFLFRIGYDNIAAVVHPQSIIHSMVEFVDGSVLAQMGFPTMELPILYAFSYPDRLPYASRRFDPVAAGTLTFEPVREERFPAFRLGVDAGRAGGTAPAVFNAANEVAVAAFLAGRIGFQRIAESIDSALQAAPPGPADSLEAVQRADAITRERTQTFIGRHALC